MHFQKLRVIGFKSFLDPVEIQIEDGITGIVGPNGCGKSNVVEALKWVMGETSAKQMRGGEMDDVIFGGTSHRPARNIAEVALVLDNADRTAPSPFNDSTELEIIRRIERGAGSNYKVNGKDVRARDVQLLFADLATGAHSTAMVNQGRIGAIISAQPTKRRGLLEEAADIKGLHSRRHEAELRLRAAETNLERLDDVITALEGQFQGLKRQARQAARYRRLGGHVRRHEAILLHLRWQEAVTYLESTRENLTAAEAEVTSRTGYAIEAGRLQAEIAANLPELRQAEAKAAAELQRFVVAQRELEAEDGRINDALAGVEERLRQIKVDIKREKSLSDDAVSAIQRIDAENARIETARNGRTERIKIARLNLEEITEILKHKELELSELTQIVAAANAKRDALLNRKEELGRRHYDLTEQINSLQQERETLLGKVKRDVALEEGIKNIARAEDVVETARNSMTALETNRVAAEQNELKCRNDLQKAQSQYDRLRAEEGTLANFLKEEDSDLFPPLIDAIEVSPGYEKALGAALDDDLTAPIDTAAAVHWAVLPPLETTLPLPEGIRPLSDFVKGPVALARRICTVGVIDVNGNGKEIQPLLHSGQRLVSTEGGLWRWDGFTVSAGAQTAAAVRLSQRNRLIEIRKRLSGVEKNFDKIRETHIASQIEARKSVEDEQQARSDLQSAYDALSDAQNTQATIVDATADTRLRLESLGKFLEQIRSDLTKTIELQGITENSILELADPAKTLERQTALQSALELTRTTERERRGTYERIVGEEELSNARLSSITHERISWDGRLIGARDRIKELELRQSSEKSEKTRLSFRPEEIKKKLSELLNMIEASEQRRSEEGDRLTSMENNLTDADATARQAEVQLSSAREERVRIEANVEQAKSICDSISDRITERLQSTPERILADAEIDLNSELPSRELIELKLEKLVRERDNMGPVNLRAEQELMELEEQIKAMLTERNDLVSAIARLRQGISTLNSKGRSRMLAAFEEVNRHFEELFVSLFGGGHAHLTLTEADDPLEAGLEIMASPPGKKLQVMSLLSGGEQALTALALLFAVFLTNPAPICVLDEVDAPLDDANVERFCNLLIEINKASKTRFLVVTHHRLTMAKMDRLFGVTMGEMGISQLVSVDLRMAEEIRDTA